MQTFMFGTLAMEVSPVIPVLLHINIHLSELSVSVKLTNGCGNDITLYNTVNVTHDLPTFFNSNNYEHSLNKPVRVIPSILCSKYRLINFYGCLEWG